METSKTQLWDKLSHTDPKHTKTFKRAGGFEGTAIKPMWSYHRMTEEYGPCGEGWGIGQPVFQVVPAGEETLVYCTVSVWHGSRENVIYGVGGDKVAGKNKYGLNTDDEAFKKAFTDGITNALKMIGVGADVHMGMFDDNKYVNDMRAKFGDEKPLERTPVTPNKKVMTGDEFLILQDDIKAATTLEELLAAWTKINAVFKTSIPNPEQLKTLTKAKDDKKYELDNITI